MGPVATALLLQAVFVLLAFGCWRTVAQLRATGSTGFVAHRERGLAAKVGGLFLCLAAQRAMGVSWRVGVDPDERTDLVTDGLFGRMRRPVFTAMLLFAAGSALAVPTAVTVGGLLLATAGIVAQVLVVEEPHLRRQHGPANDDHLAASSRRSSPTPTSAASSPPTAQSSSP